jgi:poly(hydroxyalkanoate) granule-associated protein
MSYIKEKAKDLQEDVKDSAQKIYLAGLGALTVAGEEGNKLFKTLVERGEKFESGAKIPTDGLKNTAETVKGRASDIYNKIEDMVNDQVGFALQRLGVPTRDEINNLSQQVDALREAIEKMAEKPAAADKAE